MNEIYRVCAQCGGRTPLDVRHCPACGWDTQSGLPMRRSLPVAVGRAALPVAASLAGLVLRAGWKLLQARWANQAAIQASAASAISATQEGQGLSPAPVAQRTARRTIRIRSSWAVGDANGIWRQGQEEHLIEIDE